MNEISIPETAYTISFGDKNSTSFKPVLMSWANQEFPSLRMSCLHTITSTHLIFSFRQQNPVKVGIIVPIL